MQALNLAVWDSPCSRHIRRKRSIFHLALWLVTCKKKPLSMRRPEGMQVRHRSSSPGTCVITFSLWDRGELSAGAGSAPFKSRMSRSFERSVAPSSWPQTHTFGLACCLQPWKNSLCGMPAPAPACQHGALDLSTG